MRINEDFIEDIDVDEIKDEQPVTEHEHYDFAIQMIAVFDDATESIYRKTAENQLYNYLDQFPFITTHSGVCYESTSDDYLFSFSHDFKNPKQIIRFITGLFKFVNRGLRQEVIIRDLRPGKEQRRKDDKNFCIYHYDQPVICYFIRNDESDTDCRIWVRAAQACQMLMPGNNFTVEQIADAIPGYNIEKLYEKFLVSYKTRQFSTVEELDDEVAEGWKPDPERIKKFKNQDDISYIQLLAYDLAEGHIKVHTDHYGLFLKHTGLARFCKSFYMEKTGPSYHNINNNFLFAYLGDCSVDYGNGERATIICLCVKFSENISSNEMISLIAK